MVKRYYSRIASFLVVIIGFLICPPKSVSFDNLVYSGKTLTALGMLLLAYYLWNLRKK